MSAAISQTGPITITAPIKVRVVTGPLRIRLGGQPEPEGKVGHFGVELTSGVSNGFCVFARSQHATNYLTRHHLGIWSSRRAN
jgi:hypothetical protein